MTLHPIDTTPQTDLADRAHARLESLMRANRAIVAELSLETLLSLVVEQRLWASKEEMGRHCSRLLERRMVVDGLRSSKRRIDRLRRVSFGLLSS